MSQRITRPVIAVLVALGLALGAAAVTTQSGSSTTVAGVTGCCA